MFIYLWCNISDSLLYKLRVALSLYLCFSDRRQHGQCCLGVGCAEDEPGGGARADNGRALLSVGPPTPPAGPLYGQHQTLPLVPSRLRFCPSPHWRWSPQRDQNVQQLQYKAYDVLKYRISRLHEKSPPNVLELMLCDIGLIQVKYVMSEFKSQS